MDDKIIVVDDEREIADLIGLYLENDGYEVHKFLNGADALSFVEKCEPALAVLDVMLPDTDGFALLRKMREKHDFPIIMLTARVTDSDKILGLTIGADDYITKPFGVMELLSRIKAVLRRAGKQNAEADVIEEQGVSLDASRRICTYNGQEVVLTYKEFELLMYLMRHKSIAVSRDKLMEMVWGYEFAGETRTVDMHIKTLRQKLEAAGCTDLIKTVRGIGYKI